VPDPIDALILDLLEWIGPRSRPYADVMDAWRTSCPRLTVWEDATERGLVESSVHDDGGRVVRVTARGRELLATRGRGTA
jgi:D-3-phosphoglycerate dehydrogenase